MENSQMNRMQMIRDRINSFPAGSISESNHYWCITCKKFFVLDKPECPYMTGMCVNTPIAVENLAPESTESLEKFGLFYPKIPQRILSEIIKENYFESGRKLAEIYLDFIREWRFDISKEQPLQTLKSFIIILSGCETAQRVNEGSVTFVLMDAGKIWEKEKIKKVILGGLGYLKSALDLKHELNVDFIDILGERETGKYYCAKCGMFFEFGIRRETVTCPLMAQKCMFDPQHIDTVNYTPDKLLKQIEITPDIFRKFIRSITGSQIDSEKLNALSAEWKISDSESIISHLM
jgi:DNA-directed RNA polymerase subunit RPC12/RpoP